MVLFISVKSLLDVGVLTSGGRHVGFTQDICIDPAGVRLAALVVVRPGLWRTLHMLYWQDVAEITASSLIVPSENVLRPLSEIPDGWWATHREPGVWGRRLHASDGRLIGLVSDLLINRRGKVIGCRVSDGLLKDLLAGQPRLLAQVSVSADGEGLTVRSDA